MWSDFWFWVDRNLDERGWLILLLAVTLVTGVLLCAVLL